MNNIAGIEQRSMFSSSRSAGAEPFTLRLTSLAVLLVVPLLFVGFASCSGKKGSGDVNGDETGDGADDGMQDQDSEDVSPDGDLPPDIDADDPGIEEASDAPEDVVCPDPCIYYVDLGVAAPGDGLTPETAFRDVQSGIDAAFEAAGPSCRCEVRVAEAVYFVHDAGREDTIRLREGVEVYGGYPAGFAGERDPEAHLTVLDGRAFDDSGGGEESPRVFHVVTGSDGALIDGFTITRGLAVDDEDEINPDNYGGGMVNADASPRVVDCTFADNEAVYGGGMYVVRGSPEITNARFLRNTATQYGGGMDSRNSALMIAVISFSENQAAEGGGLYVGGGSSLLVTTRPSRGGACLFAGNTAGNGGGASASYSTFAAEGCRFEDNSATASGGGLSTIGSTAVIANVVFTGNSAPEGAAMADRGGENVGLVNCTIAGNDVAAEGVVTASPDPERPTRIINSIVWGNSDFGSSSEIRGNASIERSLIKIVTSDEGEWDVGEYRQWTGQGNVFADPVFLDAAGGDFRLHPISPAVDHGILSALPPDAADMDGDGNRTEPLPLDFAGAQRLQGAGVDMGAFEAPSSDNDAWPRIHVDGNATGSNDGTSWVDAFTSLHDGLAAAAAAAPMQVWVAAGTYVPRSPAGRTATFLIEQNVAVYGGFDPAEGDDTFAERDPAANVTILSGDQAGNDGTGFEGNDENVYHVVTSNRDALIDGFTVTRGFAYTGFYLDDDNFGGGLFSRWGHVRVVDCRFRLNWAGTNSSGGGAAALFWESSAELVDCAFEGNHGFHGGGLYARSTFDVSVAGCSFAGNTVSVDGGDGGGIYLDLQYSGDSSQIAVANCIVWGNVCEGSCPHPQVGAYWEITEPLEAFAYSDVDEELPAGGVGNIQADPLFETGSLALTAGSPCIDAGRTDAVTTLTDLGGAARLADGDGDGTADVDMGAFEYQP
jgi:predicted outer membrane repeat protein